MKIAGKIGENVNMIEQIKKYIQLYYNHYSQFPTMEWLLKKTGLKTEQINKILQSLIDSRFLILEAGNKLKLNNPKKEVIKKRTYIKKEKPDNNIWIDILRYVLLVIGIGAVYMSIDYTWTYFEGLMPSLKAFLLSFIMVVFAVSSFELIIIFKDQKKYFYSILFLFLWFVVTIFSMFSTIAGQYNARIPEIQKQINSQSSVVYQEKQKAKQTETENRIKDRIKQLSEERSRYLKMIAEYDTKEKIEKGREFYGSLKWEYQKIQNRIDKEEKLLDKNIKPITKKVQNIESWFGNLFGFDAAWVQFWLSLIPAIFIDLIAPFSFMIVIFLRNKKER